MRTISCQRSSFYENILNKNGLVESGVVFGEINDQQIARILTAAFDHFFGGTG